MPLTNTELRILADAVVVGRWYVVSDTIVPIGRLIATGYLDADDDYDGPLVFPTEKGKKSALKRNLVKPADDLSSSLTGFSYTAAARKL